MATHIKISTITVGAGGAASIDFTSIPATYTDLVLVLSGRATSTTDWATGVFNNDTTATNYSYKGIQGNGASASSNGNPTNGNFFLLSKSSNTASTFGSSVIYIPNYLSANYKSASIDTISETNGATAYSQMTAFLWSSTAAINQITLTISGDTFAEFSSATLYGIKSS